MAERTGLLKRLQGKVRHTKHAATQEQILQKQIEDLRRIIEMRDEMFRRSDDENTSLQQQLQVAQDESERLRREKSELEQAYKLKQLQLEELEQDKVAVAEKVTDLERALADMTTRLSQQQQHHETTEAATRQLEEQVEKLQVEVSEAVAERNRLEVYSTKLHGYLDDYRVRLQMQSRTMQRVDSQGLKSLMTADRIFESLEAAREAPQGQAEGELESEAKEADTGVMLEVDASSRMAARVKGLPSMPGTSGVDLLSGWGVDSGKGRKWAARPSMTSIFSRWHMRAAQQQ